VVLSELAELGLRRAVRVGTCVAAGKAPAAGAGLVVGAAVAEDGASAALGSSSGSVIEPDALLLGRLGAIAGLTPATVVSRDVIPSASASDPGAEGGVRVRVLDLQTAATFTFCRGRGIAAAAVLAVASSAGRRLEDEPLEGALLGLAGMAASALTPDRV
jgi:uridine phosphorylase